MKRTLASFGCLLLLCVPVAATALTFDFTPQAGNNTRSDQGYADRVTAATVGGYAYGTTGGFTPNVVVGYGPIGPGPDDYIYFCDHQFGDLVNVIAQLSPSAPFIGILEVTLTADPGFFVSLHAFDLAGWNRADKLVNAVQVLSSLGAPMLSQSPATIVGASGHTSYSNLTLTDSSLTIRIDASNLGFDGAYVGIDNITFSQNIPEPSTVLLGGALIALGLRHARRR